MDPVIHFKAILDSLSNEWPTLSRTRRSHRLLYYSSRHEYKMAENAKDIISARNNNLLQSTRVHVLNITCLLFYIPYLYIFYTAAHSKATGKHRWPQIYFKRERRELFCWLFRGSVDKLILTKLFSLPVSFSLFPLFQYVFPFFYRILPWLQ